MDISNNYRYLLFPQFQIILLNEEQRVELGQVAFVIVLDLENLTDVLQLDQIVPWLVTQEHVGPIQTVNRVVFYLWVQVMQKQEEAIY